MALGCVRSNREEKTLAAFTPQDSFILLTQIICMTLGMVNPSRGGSEVYQRRAGVMGNTRSFLQARAKQHSQYPHPHICTPEMSKIWMIMTRPNNWPALLVAAPGMGKPLPCYRKHPKKEHNFATEPVKRMNKSFHVALQGCRVVRAPWVFTDKKIF